MAVSPKGHCNTCSPHGAPVQVLLPANAPGKATEDGPSPRAPACTCETWMESQAPGFRLAWSQPLHPFGE